MAEGYDEEEAELDFGRVTLQPQRWVGQCPNCGVYWTIRESGRLWHHGPNNRNRCPGSGAEPVAGTRRERTRPPYH